MVISGSIGSPPMVHSLLGADDAFAHQQLHVAVIARAIDDAALAQVVDTAVARVREIRSIALHEHCGARRARPLLERHRRAELHHALMRIPEADMQEAVRIHQGLYGLREQLQQIGDRNLGCTLAIGMPAHAVAHHEHGGATVLAVSDAVLVVFPRTLQRDFCAFDLQANSDALGTVLWAKIGDLYITPRRPSTP
jgi:hypothetical protein